MESWIDLLEFLARQRTERYRAFIVHGPPMSGKTKLARALAEVADVYYLDLQARFAGDSTLASSIDRFGVPDLKELLLNLEVPQPVVAVDNLDFLLNTWSAGRKEEFAMLVEKLLESPAITDKTFVFFLQTDRDVVGRPISNTRGESRILKVGEIKAVRGS